MEDYMLEAEILASTIFTILLKKKIITKKDVYENLRELETSLPPDHFVSIRDAIKTIRSSTKEMRTVKKNE